MVTTKDFLFILGSETLREPVEAAARAADATVRVALRFDEALEFLDADRFKYLFIDLDHEVLKPLQVLEWIQTRQMPTGLGAITQKPYGDIFMQAMRLGVTEFLSVEWAGSKMLSQRLSQWLTNYDVLKGFTVWRAAANAGDAGPAIVGEDPAVRSLAAKIRKWVCTDLPLLIVGEPGVGKSLFADVFARELGHMPVVRLPCDTLAEYEQKNYFSHEFDRNLSRAAQASRPLKAGFVVGEIGRLDAELQEMLADYFKTRLLEFSGKTVPATIHLVATSSERLEQRVQEGTFREDLYRILKPRCHRLPPLRCRPGDLAYLIEYFMGDSPRHFSRDAVSAMGHYDWPGNVRELKETVAATMAKSSESLIPARLLPTRILEKSFYQTASGEENLADFTYHEAKKRILNKFNRTYIAEILERSEQNLTVAAEKAGMDRSNFKKIIKKYGLL